MAGAVAMAAVMEDFESQVLSFSSWQCIVYILRR